MDRFIIVLIIFSFLSCQNYDSQKYIKMENEAINDIVLEMTEFEEMKRINNWVKEKPKLFIISELDTTKAWTIEPNGYDIGTNGVHYSKERIAKNKNEFEEDLAKYEKEERLFNAFEIGKIQKRNLNYIFTIDKLEIEIIESTRFKNFNFKENVFGYLSISRIIFNEDFTKGYLHFRFFCGAGCAWNSNIEIKKVNGKWEITEYFSGGIA